MKSQFDRGDHSLLQHKRIYFGHQSVGENIVQGLRHLGRTDPGQWLNIVETSDPVGLAAPVFAHSRIGRNHEPRNKIDAFSENLAAGIGNRADIALLKFCYVDVTEGVDVPGLFRYYREVMAQLAAAYPHTRLVHVTVPLTVMPGLLRRIVGGLRRRRNRAAYDNLARAEYNRLLVGTYSGSEPVFDLATAESTAPSGRTLRYTVDGRPVATLVPSYSSDGRHLSGTGQHAVAAALLRCLSAVAADPTPAVTAESPHD